MSLVITSSSQNDYDTTSTVEGGIQKPSSFQNFLNSPLTLDMDTEVSVVSVKCNRDENSVIIGENEGFYLYWGDAAPDNFEAGLRQDINSALQIIIPRGEYSPLQLAVKIKNALDTAVLKAYAEIKSITVDALYTDGLFQGYSITYTQKGDGSALTKKPVASKWTSYIGPLTIDSFNQFPVEYSGRPRTRNATVTADGADVKITGYNATNAGELCDVIGKAHPLSMVNGQFLATFNGSSADGGDPDGYTIGLIRSMGTTDAQGVQRDFVDIGGIHDVNELKTQGTVNLPVGYGEDPEFEVPFVWDVAFNWAPGKDGQVVQLSADGDRNMEIQTITPLFTPINASLQEGVWDAVEFKMDGEKMTISLRIKATGVLQKMVDGDSTTFGSRVKPFGITCNQLYPKVAIHQNDDKDPGVVVMKTWNGHDDEGYYDQNFWGYGGPNENFMLQDEYEVAYEDIDTCSIYIDGKYGLGGGTVYPYKGLITGDKGIANNWTLVFSENFLGFEPEYQPDKLAPSLDRMRLSLGFDKDLVLEASASGVGTAEVSFISDVIPDFIQPKGSMFVRMKNMSINSYNANKSSISNIIYSIPRFDVRGNTEGNMFYEPAERVYVSLNNATKMILNTVEIDFVDINERIIDDLVGNTIVVLHFRKRS